MTARASTVDEVLALYEAWGGDPYDEHLSQLAHALQTAALAEAAGVGAALVAASLLHDVGHLLALASGGRAPGPGEADGDDNHEHVGARYLAAIVPPSVTRPIALHVSAKRYLCATDPGYHARLSPGSVRSLARQGGPMTATEVSAFEARPGFDDALLLRGWDDEGKVDGLRVPPLSHYQSLLADVSYRPSPP